MKNSDDFIGYFFGVLVCGLALTPMATFLIREHIPDEDAEDIIIKEAPFLGADIVKANSKKDKNLNFLKLDVNKNGVFDNGDIVITDTNNLPLVENKNIVYYENKKNNKKAVVAYQNKDDEYILNPYEVTENVRNKFNKYMTDNKQR